MTLLGRRAGRSRIRPALVLAALGVGVGLAAAARNGAGTARGPVAEPNPDWTPPAESLVGSVRHVYQAEARERLHLDTLFPDAHVALLWFEGRPASHSAHLGAVVLDGAGGVVRFDERLTPHRVALELEGRTPISVAAAADGGVWFTDGQGSVLRVGADGRIAQTVPAPFDYPATVADPQGGAWLVRSAELFSYRLVTGSEPLLVHLSDSGSVGGVGSILVPEHVLLAELANAGHVAVADDAIYFAPFIRDEVVALSRTGDSLWIAHRGLPQSTPDPRFEIGDAGPTIDYAPVNLGIGLGPDDRLYVLSVPGFTTSESRVDVYDPETGDLERSARLPTPLPTAAVDEEGRLYLLDPFRLLTGVAPREREAFRSFDLEVLDEGRMTQADLKGKVVLVNFWASWCAPCRLEMPALDTLRRSIDHPDFEFVAMNDDVSVGDAEAFLEEYGFDFPVLLGRGKLRQQYHYMGLPYTVLLDREARVVQRWIGFAGGEQIAGIRAVIQAELARGGDASGPAHDGHAGKHRN